MHGPSTSTDGRCRRRRPRRRPASTDGEVELVVVRLSGASGGRRMLRARRRSTRLPAHAVRGLAGRGPRRQLSRAAAHAARGLRAARAAHWRFAERRPATSAACVPHARVSCARDGAAALAAAARRGRAARLQARRRAGADRRAASASRDAAGAGARARSAWSSPPVTRARRCARCETARARLRGAQHRADVEDVARRRLRAASTRSRCSTPTTATRSVLVVGHEPSFSQVVYDFTGAAWTSRRAASPRSASRHAGRAARAAAPARARSARAVSRLQRGAAITASATSARGCSDASRTNSSGLWALPPRGPRPSTVTGIVAAKWLASLAPPRRGRRDRPAERAPRALEQRRGRARSECMPGQRRISSGVAARRRRPRPGSPSSTRLDRVEVVGAQVAERARRAPGTTLNASPERITVGTAVRWSGRAGRGGAATAWAAAASASSALRPRSGAEPECARAAVAR